MITPVIKIVKAAFDDALNTFKSNLNELVPDIYSSFSQEEQGSIITWFNDPKKQFRVLSGYPQNPQQIPCISITLDSSNEADEDMGTEQHIAPAADGIINEFKGTKFRSLTNCLCLSDNYNFAYYMSLFAKWALLWERVSMTASGLSKQKISMQELDPAEMLINQGGMQDSIFVYQFSVSLGSEHVDSITSKYPAITSVTADVTLK